MTCIKCDREDIVAHGLCMKDYQRARRAGTLGLTAEEAKRKEKEVNLKAHHNITLREYEDLLYIQQEGICPLCMQPAPTIGEMFSTRFWHVDHNRLCCPSIPTRGDCIRGILCPTCNAALSKLLQDREWVTRSLSYLDNSFYIK